MCESVFLDLCPLQSVDVQLHRSQQPSLLHDLHSVHVAGDVLRCQLWVGKDVRAPRYKDGEQIRNKINSER
jgi:hypothetical protein